MMSRPQNNSSIVRITRTSSTTRRGRVSVLAGGPGRFVLPGIMVLASLASIGCKNDVSDTREEGMTLFRNHQYIESMATFRHALELEPNDAQSNYYMGMNYRVLADRKFRDGDPVNAGKLLDISIVYFSQAVKTWPNYMAAIHARNEAQESRGKYEEALATAVDVTHTNRGEAIHFVYLGNEYRERGDYDNALANYKTALRIDPRCVPAFASMGKLYLLIGDRSLAEDSYLKAYELEPRNEAVLAELDRLSIDPRFQSAEYASPNAPAQPAP